ncbi:MAG: hypothetical protein ABIN89_25590 [Chitinophagaceae bacterium]
MKNSVEINLPVVEDPSSTVVMHHLSSFLDNDMKALMSDYTNESVLITQDAIYTGLTEIESYLAGLVIHFPKGKANLELDKIVVRDKLVYIVWHATTPTLQVTLGSDTFIIKEGKIFIQTFVGVMKFVD